jgi:hypothetical protein
MTIANLGEVLEEIGEGAFYECLSLREISIPPTVKAIKDRTFSGCSSLTRVVFSYKNEEFVATESMRDWWNHGVHEKSLKTYYFFLVNCSIPNC